MARATKIAITNMSRSGRRFFTWQLQPVSKRRAQARGDRVKLDIAKNVPADTLAAGTLSEHASKEILKSWGIPVTTDRLLPVDVPHAELA